MVTKIQKWGNSQGLRLPKQLLEAVRLTVGDDVEVSAQDGYIVIAAARPARAKRDLQDLISRIPKGYKADVVEWGKAVGNEVW